MEALKEYTISWLDWGAEYVKEEPADFLSKCKITMFSYLVPTTVIPLVHGVVMMILLPLFVLSGVLAYYLIRQIDKEEKRKGRWKC